VKLDGRVAIVTGGGSGIGAATAALFAAEGARVAVIDIDAAAADAVAADLPDAMFAAADVTKSTEIDAAVTQVVAHFGRIDVLMHAAGIDVGAEWKQRVGSRMAAQAKARTADQPVRSAGLSECLDDEAWHRVVSVNLDGTFFTCRAVLRQMVEQRSGSVITVASNAAQIGIAGMPHYVASKAGVIGLTRSLAREFAPVGIRVNTIAPGAVDTPMFRRNSEKVRQGAAASAPLGRVGEADEIARVALFLASDDSSYLIGETVNANGGTFLP